MMRLSRLSLAIVVALFCFSFTSPARAQECMGVRITTPEGPRALIGVMALGSTSALERIRAAALALRLSVRPPTQVNGRPAIVIFFDDSVVTSEQATELIRRIREGDLSQDGEVRVDLDVQVMPIDVLRGCHR